MNEAKRNELNTPSGSKPFGQWLKTTRKYHGLTLDDMVKRSGLAKGYLSDLENGKKQNAGLETAQKITKAFNMELWRVLKTFNF